MSMSEMAPRGQVELPELPVSSSWTEFGETMGSVGPGTHKRAKSKGFGGKAWKDIKRVSGDNVRKVGDYGNAVPGIGGLVGGGMDRRGRARKSRGRFRT
jgi:hypothetical protein